MMRKFAFLGLALAAIGCGSKDGKPAAESAAPAPVAGKPAADEATACIVTYLNQCGWKDVELTGVAPADVPAGAKVSGEAWAYSFTARYSNVFGERRTSANWVAVVGRPA